MTHKMLLRHALALGFVVSAIAARPNALAAQQKHGDVNGDGAVSALDAQAILTSVVGLPLPANYIVANGDANCDNQTTALDAQIVLSAVIGLDVSQYCVGQAFGSTAIKVAITPPDSSVLIGRSLAMKATLRDANGFAIKRPIAWSTSAPAITALDSVRNDTLAFFHGAAPGSATITATADGSSIFTHLKVFLTYAGIIVTPQRPDTLRQLNSTYAFTARNRDSVGLVSGAPTGFWTVTDTNIVTVSPVTATNSATVTAKSMGSTYLRLVSSSSPTVKDSVPLTVQFPAIASCSAPSGTIHPSAIYTTPQTWGPSTNPHFVTGSQTFNSGSKLTVLAGTVVCFNSGQAMLFHAGSKMIAQGTAAQPITFTGSTPTTIWGGIQFGDFLGVAPSTDTSIITNALFERFGSTTLSGREQHALILDSVRVRQVAFGGVQIHGPGSRVSRSVIDTVGTSGGSFAVTVGSGTLEFTTIHGGPNTSGVAIADSGTIRNVDMTGGSTGIAAVGGVNGARVNNVTLSGLTAFAVDLPNVTIDTSSRNVSMTGGTGGAFRGQIGNLAILFPDSLKQGVLKGQGKDTLIITGGSAKAATVVARPDLPWQLLSEAIFDSASVLAAHPGSRFQFANADLRFRNGGRLVARGSSALPIRFQPKGASSFYGLVFENQPLPGGTTPPPAPFDTSYLVNVRIDSAGGVCGSVACAAVSTYDRHVVVIDSSVIRQGVNYGAAALIAPGSRISRSRIDTTGASYAALTLGARTLAESTTVRRGGGTGVYVYGDSVRLRGVQVLNNVGIGLDATTGLILGDSGSVTLTGNARPFKGYIDSFAALARDTVAQLKFVGNVSDTAVIWGGSTRTFHGRLASGAVDTLRAMKGLPLRFEDIIYIDTLARFVPNPGVRLTFNNGGLLFQRGGRLIARGTATDTITFERYATGAFYGLKFNNPYLPAGSFPPPAPADTSILVRVRVSDANSYYSCAQNACGAIAADDRHVVWIDSARIRQSTYSAVVLNAPGSRVSRTIIDTTGSPTSSYAAIVLGNNTLAESTTVRRSGQSGIYAVGSNVRLRGMQVLNSVSYGLDATGGTLLGDSAGVTLTGNASPFKGYVDNFAMLARDTVAQLKFIGNVSDTVVVWGGINHAFRGKVASATLDTLHAMKSLPWRVEDVVFIDSLARFLPHPGTRLKFNNGGLQFQKGGRLFARGSATDSIYFERWSTAYFYGLKFNSPYLPGGSFPPPAPMDTSVLVRAKVSDANTYSSCAQNACGAVAADDRHVVWIDSTRIRQSAYAAVVLNAPGSRVSRTIIDTTGTPTASYAAIVLGDATLAESTTVRRSGQSGIFVVGSSVRLRGMQVLNSVGYGLEATGGRLLGDSAGVTLIGNASPFRGYVDNFAVLARDTVAQLKFIGNASDTVVVWGGAAHPFRGKVGSATLDTLHAMKLLPWRVEDVVFVDSLARFIPHPGSHLKFNSGGLVFQKGGRLVARGTVADSIYFERWSTGYFYGLKFNNPYNPGGSFPPPTPIDTSILARVLVSDANTYAQCAANGCGAVAADDRHVLWIDSTRVRQSAYAAIVLNAPGSHMVRVLVDTTGFPTTNTAAVILANNARADSSKIRRSGYFGMRIVGAGVTLSGDSIIASQGVGLSVEATVSLSNFVITGSTGDGVQIWNNNVALSTCDVISSGAHGINAVGSPTGVAIHLCNLEANALRAVNNPQPTSVPYLIDASSNWWGQTTVPAVGAANGPSLNVTTATPLASRRVP